MSPLLDVDSSTPPEAINGNAPPTMTEEDKIEPVAIIGLSLRFPQEATSPEAFWEMLMEGRSAMTEIPKDRFNLDAYYHPNSERPGTINIRGAHFVKEDIAVFDAPFFSITPGEASCMDPQQRGLLECAYWALENAGVPMEKAAGSNTSVHIGCWTREYESLFQRDHEMRAKYLATGTGNAMTANRISWFYNFLGPSIAIDTACSSSLNALHLACQALRNREASMGLVGGCNLFYNADAIAPLTNLNFLGPDSVSYSFDHRANGYARGEGFGIVVVKLLSEALKDGDTIRAVIRASGSNQDGRTPGITQPSSEAQEILIRETYARAGLDLKTTRFFEAHGTGTPVGDPLEASAIGAVFKNERSPDEPLIVGAVKSNIGHLEGASGIAGLIKSVLVLEHGIIPPNIWFEKPNPMILPDWNLKFPTKPTLWPTKGLRRISVNSFGYGGTNAHAILDDAYHYLELRNLSGRHYTVKIPTLPEPAAITDAKEHSKETNGINGIHNINGFIASDSEFDVQEKINGHSNGVSVNPTSNGAEDHDGADQGRPRLFVWSSYDEDGLKRLASSYADYLASHPQSQDGDAFLDKLAYTLLSKRSVFPWKAFTIAGSHTQLLQNIKSGLSKPVRSASAPKIGFVFTGQGAQWHAMGCELSVYRPYRDSLESADRYLKSLGCKWSLVEELTKDASLSNIDNPAYSQPICAAVQMALVDLLAHCGVRPAAVVGHSSGEIAAAYCAGGISKESAWRIAYFRGLLSAALAKFGRSRGAMMAVGLSEAAIQSYIDKATKQGSGYVAIGCINSPNNVTLTGSIEALTNLQGVFAEEDIFCQLLKVENAYHSKLMEDIALDYWKRLGTLETNKVSPNNFDGPVMFASVTGDRIPINQVGDAEYWVRNMVSPVRFSEALSQMMSQSSSRVNKKLGMRNKAQGLGINYLLEIGPHGALRRSVKEILEVLPKQTSVSYDSLLTRNVPALQTALEAMGRLHCSGFPVDLNALNSPDPGNMEMLVELPEYPFNHANRYWSESRISKNIRFRKHPRNDLLGTQVPDWDPAEARWRMYVRISENEWIRDHKIMGNLLYPGSGMLVMAIEAARQLAEPERKILGFKLKETVFDKALIIPSTADGIEIQFHLRPAKISNFAGSIPWSEFKLCSFDNGEWRDHCRGHISIEYETEPSAIGGGKEKEHRMKRNLEEARDLVKNCNILVDPSSLYEICETYGLTFGPAFQTLTSIRYNMQREAVASVQVKDAVKPGGLNDFVIHPSTLDGILQTIFPALAKGGQEAIQTVIPTFIQEVWISRDICEQYDVIKACTKAKTRGFREAECRVVASDETGNKLLAVVNGFRVTSVASKEASRETEWRRLCFNIDWRPDIDLLDIQQAQHLFSATKTTAQISPDQRNEDMEFIGFYFISKALENIRINQPTPPKEHLGKYIRWMRHQIERYENGEVLHGRPNWPELIKDEAYVEKTLQSIAESHEGKLALRIGPNLSAILRGDADPLELLFKDDLLPNLYRFGMGADIGYEKIESYVDAMSHKRPSLNIIEIGAGTGGTAIPILETLSRHGEKEAGAPRFSHYMFTDISPSFFEKAKETFKDHVDRMTFKVLDIEHDPVEQGFEAGVYDLVIASNVLHATKDLDVTLRNTRRLLKPGGKLLLFEICNPDIIRGGFAFGLLPGWWLSVEPNRRWGPLMYEHDWAKFLLRNGFTGNDIALRDWPDERNHMTSVIVSSAAGDVQTLKPMPTTVIVAESNSSFQQKVARELKSRLEVAASQETSISVRSPADDVQIPLKGIFCIFLLELEHPFLTNLDAEGFACLHHMMTADDLLWLTRSGPQVAHDPAFELVTGFARSIRSEDTSFKFTTLALESFNDPSKICENAVKVIETTTLQSTDDVEEEFAEIDGVICINRIVEANYINDDIARRQFLQQAEALPLSVERPVKLTIASPGLLDTLQFVDDLLYDKPLGDNEVELEVKATSMNFLDVMIALAQIPEDFLGGECSGIVTRVGKNSWVKPGDHVWTGTIDAYRTFARTPDSLVQLIPEGLSFEEAASLPIVYGTCYYALFDVGRLKAGEKILIHSAAGGVGQAAIWLAKLIGAEIFATVGTLEKREFLVKTFGIPEDHIFSSRDTSFALGVMNATNGVGVDVVLNSLAAESLRATWDCIAPFGRFLEIGKKDIINFGNLPMLPFAKNVSFAAVDLLYIMRHNLPLAKRIFDDVRQLVEQHKIQAPQPIHMYTYSHIEEAFRVLQTGKHIGKIVVKPEFGEVVPIVPDSRPSYHFDANATYVIAGGLGGLGRSMARWMARRGARNLILLSRSGVTTETAKTLVSELEAMGCIVATPQCDVSNERELSTTLLDCLKTMPPVKGCIQGAMVLKDSIFSNMSLADYMTAVGPKVKGSWNLHKLLPKGMDFFILLSSGSGVFGGPSQSNYGSGNTYQDALARYRIGQGEKAVSLDLGMILSVGFAAERPETLDMLRSRGYMPIRETEFLGMLEYHCDPARPLPSMFRAQVATGIETPASLRLKGIDEPFWMPKPLFRNMYQMDNVSTDAADVADGFGDFQLMLGAVTSLAEAGAVVATALTQKLAKALSMLQADIDPSKPMHVYGVDSLVAVEMRNWLAKEIRADIAVFELMGNTSITELGGVVASKSSYLPVFAAEEI